MAENSSSPQAEKSKPASRAAAADVSEDGGLASEVQALHEGRTVVPSRPEVDARLDSRSAEQVAEKPAVGPDDAKPQHVDGPDVAGQAAHTAATLKKKR